MTRSFDAKDAIVPQAIDGMIRASGGMLVRLDGCPHILVVVRTDWDRGPRRARLGPAVRGANRPMRASSGAAC